MSTSRSITSERLESTTLLIENCYGRKEEVKFNITKEWYSYSDGTVEPRSTIYAKIDERDMTSVGNRYFLYSTEKGYRNAIKRLSK